jgi:nickel-dependent lactate racemase
MTVSLLRKSVLNVFSGNPGNPWLDGVKSFSAINRGKIDQTAGSIIVSPGRFPESINLRQAHKALEVASRPLTPRGTMILVAECREGPGHPVFSEWVMWELSADRVGYEPKRGFRFGAHKRYYPALPSSKARCILDSSLGSNNCEDAFLAKAPPLARLLKPLHGRYGPTFEAHVIPHRGLILPTLEGS